jgi:hypothetical protein
VAKKRTEPGDPRIEALEEESQEEK